MVETDGLDAHGILLGGGEGCCTYNEQRRDNSCSFNNQRGRDVGDTTDTTDTRTGGGGGPWLDEREMRSWVRLVAVLELLPALLDQQLRRDSGMTHFDYMVVSQLSQAPERTLRMTALAQRTNATLPRLSHVVSRLEERGLVERLPCPEDRRATNARLTDAGMAEVEAAAPGHAALVRELVVDPLTRTQVDQLGRIAEAMLGRLDPEGRMTDLYDPS
jgi:DNA-binding MarR family transcriptional regulator